MTVLEGKLDEILKQIKKSKRSKSADSADKPKREFKPSEARDAWFALCTAVRAVHKKDAMKIAKILKADGVMEPTKEQIEAAVARLPEVESDKDSKGSKKSKKGSSSEAENSAESSAESSDEEPTPKPKKASKKKA